MARTRPDLIIRGGTIYDGLGAEPYTADIAICGGTISAIGWVEGSAAEEIDAVGLMVTPGFVDIHTHYDGQLTWSSQLSPSSSHGVTTVVTGNCGVGFAPCKAGDRQRLIKLLEGVEDIPEVVMSEGLPWDWETFPEYVEAVKRRPHDIDYAVQLPHAALRVYVMGERALDRAEARPEDLRQMRRLAREAIEAGALGFGTSRSIFHRSPDGSVIPTAHVDEPELTAIVEGMRDGGGGSIQVLLQAENGMADLARMQALAAATRTPMSYTLIQITPDGWRDQLRLTAEANLDGPPITAQVFPRPVGMVLGLSVSFNPFSAKPSYQRIAHLPLLERVALMRQPEVRRAIIEEMPVEQGLPGYAFARWFDKMYPLGNPPCYEPAPESFIATRAAAAGVSPDEFLYDLLLENGGCNFLLVALANYATRTLDPIREMILDAHAVPGLGDGGAHYGMISDSNYTTFLLAYWGRDRSSGRIPLPAIVATLTSKPARMLGLADRGSLEVGKRANINLIDFDRLRLQAPRVIEDLPGGGRRIMQDADGYVAILVAGKVIMRNGQPTGELPGTLATRSAKQEWRGATGAKIAI
jgi:N-acyl-D-amino-acid deacylase